MNFSTLLCVIFSRLDGEKSVNAGYYLLRGKRSGQTIQDVKYYQLQMYFSILPKLSKSVFDQAVDEMKALNYIIIDDDAILHLTTEGKELVQTAPPFNFDGWHYRGREEIFFARLSLIVQTVSQFRAGVKQFLPVQRDVEVQQFVKSILRNLPIEDPALSRKLKEALHDALEKSGMEDLQKTIFTYRLVGHGYTGWTWQQLGEQLDLSPIDVKLNYIESLHKILKGIENSDENSLLKQIAKGIKSETLLTDSTRQTKSYFDKGYSMEEIANARRLKLNTIEDHLVEIALNDPNFPLDQFVSSEARIHVLKKSLALGTKRLRPLKEAFPQLTYFQLRLILSASTKEVKMK